MLLITALSFCYSVYYSKFAKLYIEFPFLNFPIFIGEIILVLCLCLLAMRFSVTGLKLKRWHYLVIGYLVFLLLKAFYGYVKWGPLAFRNSAMFYYPLYAVVSFFSFNPELFRNKVMKYFIMALTLIVFFILVPRDTFRFTYYLLIVLFCSLIENKPLKWAVIIFFLPWFTYRLFVLASRGSLFSMFISALFFIFMYLFYFVRIKVLYKVLLIIASIAVISQFSWMVGNRVSIRSLFAFSNYVDSYRLISKKVNNVKSFKFRDLPVNLYEVSIVSTQTGKVKEKMDVEVISSSNNTLQPEAPIIAGSVQSKSLDSQPSVSSNKEKEQNFPILQPPGTSEVQKLKDQEAEEIKSGQSQKERDESAYRANLSNALWRIFVWRDMLSEWFESKMIFGCDLGKPFRSRTVEILGWSDGNWVGWLEPHNSYIHIIYRFGIIGLFLIIMLWATFVKITKNFIKFHSAKGLLLSSILLYWLCMANLNVSLELPYFAIPFWSLFGIILKYNYHLGK